MKKEILFVVFSVFVLGACSTRDVRPGVNELHSVVVRAESKESGSREAMKQAKRYCKKQRKSFAVVAENTKYEGELDEKVYTIGKRVSEAAEVIGGAIWANSGKSKKTGEVVGAAGVGTDIALGEAYVVDVKFKCQ